MDIWDLTTHQLDVIRTVVSILGGVGGFLGGVGGVAALFARYWAKKAAHNTASTEWVAGKLVKHSVAETARHIQNDTSQVADWARGHGRYRLPTSDIPRIPPEDSADQ